MNFCLGQQFNQFNSIFFFFCCKNDPFQFCYIHRFCFWSKIDQFKFWFGIRQLWILFKIPRISCFVSKIVQLNFEIYVYRTIRILVKYWMGSILILFKQRFISIFEKNKFLSILVEDCYFSICSLEGKKEVKINFDFIWKKSKTFDFDQKVNRF